MNNVLHVEGCPLYPLNVVVATDAVAATGTVMDDKQQPLSNMTAVLVPVNRTPFDLFRSVVTDNAGAFKMDRIPPGDYKAFVWDEVENGAWFDPQFMKAFEQRGTPVRVAGGQPLQLRLNPN